MLSVLQEPNSETDGKPFPEGFKRTKPEIEVATIANAAIKVVVFLLEFCIAQS